MRRRRRKKNRRGHALRERSRSRWVVSLCGNFSPVFFSLGLSLEREDEAKKSERREMGKKRRPSGPMDGGRAIAIMESCNMPFFIIPQQAPVEANGSLSPPRCLMVTHGWSYPRFLLGSIDRARSWSSLCCQHITLSLLAADEGPILKRQSVSSKARKKKGAVSMACSNTHSFVARASKQVKRIRSHFASSATAGIQHRPLYILLRSAISNMSRLR